MAILKVSRLGHPVLREKAADVNPKDIKSGKFRPLIEDMIETMHAYEGVGLAGPQVHLPIRIFVFEVEEKVAKRRGIPKLNAGVFFNATLVADSSKKVKLTLCSVAFSGVTSVVAIGEKAALNSAK